MDLTNGRVITYLMVKLIINNKTHLVYAAFVSFKSLMNIDKTICSQSASSH